VITTKIIMGIDPGLNGGIALRIQTGKLITWDLFPMPIVTDKPKHPDLDIYKFMEILAHPEYELGKVPILIVVEEPPYIPSNGGFAIRSLFKAYGEIRGVIIAQGHALTCVPPKTWQKDMLQIPPKSKTAKTDKRPLSAKKKEASIKFANSLLGLEGMELPYKGPRTKQYHDGLADAVCIAAWGVHLVE
jgi:hypothetical protein